MSIYTITKFIEEIIKIEKSHLPFTKNNYSSKECLSLHIKRLASVEEDNGNHITLNFCLKICRTSPQLKAY